MINWQWEQGRINYFRFENIRLMSPVLLQYEGMSLTDRKDDLVFRKAMQEATSLDFLPLHYTAWRNYGRMFKAALLATEISGADGKKRMVCTKLCRALAADNIESATDYILHIARAFYLNGPIFSASVYNKQKERVFPLCAIAKLVISRALVDVNNPCVSPDDCKDFLFAPQATGEEDLRYFLSLTKRNLAWRSTDQKRQIREMLIFFSQASFLKWDRGKLWLDMPHSFNEKEAARLLAQFSPFSGRRREKTPAEEILKMGSVPAAFGGFLRVENNTIILNDRKIVEGNRRMVNHLVIERSARLRKMYFLKHPSPVCDITGNPPNAGFPWVKNLLDIHHVTPLSSSVYADTRGTILENIVPLTPTSHRAVHEYYRQWLAQNNRKDFASNSEAWRVYSEAKKSYRARPNKHRAI